MKKIVLYTHLFYEFPEQIKSLKKEFKDINIVGVDSKDDLKIEIKDALAVVWGHPEPEILETAKNIEIIFIPFTGVNRLPFQYLKKREIKVSNNHGNSIIVAERAVALALALLGRIVEFHNDMCMGEWHRRDDARNPFDYWVSLQNKPVSILGCGGIGSNIACFLKGFNCHMTGFRKNTNVIPDGFERVTDNLTEAFAASDFIFFALPLTKQTKHIINEENKHLLKDKFIINVARGELIDEKVLFEVLSDGSLKGAALDSWYNYPNLKTPYAMPSRYPFQKLNNMIMSPHAASHSIEGKLYQLEHTLKNIRSWLKKGEVEDLVNLDNGY